MVKHTEIISKAKELASQLASGETAHAKPDENAPAWIGHVAVLYRPNPEAAKILIPDD